MDNLSYSENKDQELAVSDKNGSSWIKFEWDKLDEIGSLDYLSTPKVTYLPDGYTLTEVHAPSYLNVTTATTNAPHLKDAYDVSTFYHSTSKRVLSCQYDEEVDQFRNTADAALYRMNTPGISRRESSILIDALVYLIFYSSYVCLDFKYGIVVKNPSDPSDTADILLRASLRDDNRFISREIYISAKEFIEKTFTGLVKLDTNTVVENTIDALVEEVLWKLTYGEDPLFQEDLDRYAALWGIC